jgi:predicted dienelactone hydrolase
VALTHNRKAPHMKGFFEKGSRLLAAAAVLATASMHAMAQVGMSQLTLGSLPVTVSYPTAATSSLVNMGAFQLDVAMNAPPKDGRHRLVVISHGTGGSAVADHALVSKLVRAGFVVAQPLHEGDNYQDTSLAGPQSFQRRPGEISRVIDALAADPTWSPRLDLGKVGVHGMSAGGVSGLALAGAQWRMLNLVRHCNTHLQADEAFCFQGAVTPAKRAERQANYDRAKHVPELFLPAELKTWHGGRAPTSSSADPRPDTRIAAVSLAVPLAAIFSAESLARIKIPVGLISAQQDLVLLPRFHSAHVLAHCKACTLLADLPGAGHFNVLWPWPDAIAREVAAGQVRGGMPVPGFDPALRDAAQAKLVAFHLQHLASPR